MPSRSLIRYRGRQPASSRSITRFLMACVTQPAVGCAVVPRMRTRRFACSMVARMYWRCPVRVTGLNEVAGEQRFGLGAQEVRPRRGAARGRGVDARDLEDLPDGGGGDLDTERGELAVHPPVPQLGLSLTRRRTRARMERTVAGVRAAGVGRFVRDADASGRGASAGRCPVAPAAAAGEAPGGAGREKSGEEGPVRRRETSSDQPSPGWRQVVAAGR